MSRKSGVLELAVLGLLNESPMHGYELNKRLKGVLGPFRAISYGTLYPCLSALQPPATSPPTTRASEVGPGDARRRPTSSPPRARSGCRSSSPKADRRPGTTRASAYGSRSSRRPTPTIRLRILEGRRSRLEERQENATSSMSSTRGRIDRYTLELQRHGLESVEREVRWLNELIATERAGVAARPAPYPSYHARNAASNRRNANSATEGDQL